MIYDLVETLKKEVTPEYLKAIKDMLGDYYTYTLSVAEFQGTRINCALTRTYVDYQKKKTVQDVAQFSLSELPGNSQVVVSSDVYVQEAYRGKGLNNLLNKIRVEACKAAGATMMLCTVNKENVVEKKCLINNGWLPGAETATIQLWTRIL